MEINIVGVGTSISERFRTVVEDKSSRIDHLSQKAQRLDVKVTRQTYRGGRVEDDKVELTLTGAGPVVRAEATESEKFSALDVAIDKLVEQIRRAKDKRIDARNHPRSARFEKQAGTFAGLDVTPASVDVLNAVSTGSIPTIDEEVAEEEYTPVVIRSKEFAPEWLTVSDAVDRMELVGHDFFLFINAENDQPSVVYRRKGWDYGVIALAATAPPEA